MYTPELILWEDEGITAVCFAWGMTQFNCVISYFALFKNSDVRHSKQDLFTDIFKKTFFYDHAMEV